jgi:hypothetical protein
VPLELSKWIVAFRCVFVGQLSVACLHCVMIRSHTLHINRSYPAYREEKEHLAELSDSSVSYLRNKRRTAGCCGRNAGSYLQVLDCEDRAVQTQIDGQRFDYGLGPWTLYVRVIAKGFGG